MACYYCAEAKLPHAEVGICSVCNIGACYYKTGAHGERCTHCDRFLCYIHFGKHSQEHKAKIDACFPNYAKTVLPQIARFAIDSLGKSVLNSKRISFILQHGDQLSRVLNDTKIEENLRLLAFRTKIADTKGVIRTRKGKVLLTYPSTTKKGDVISHQATIQILKTLKSKANLDLSSLGLNKQKDKKIISETYNSDSSEILDSST